MSKPLRILILDTGKEWGGGTNSMLELLRRIDRERFDFTALFYANYARGDHSDIRAELGKLNIPCLIETPKKRSMAYKIALESVRAVFSYSRAAKKQAVFQLERRARIQPAARKIANLLQEKQIDLLYMNNQPSSNLEGLLAAEMTGVRTIQHARITSPLNAFEVDMANRVLARMICVSDGLREYYIRQGIAADKCVTVHNGIDVNSKPARPANQVRQEWGIPETALLVGTVGQLVARKRVDQLLCAFAHCRSRNSQAMKCLIVGDGPDRPMLEAQAEKLGVREDCIFTGFQTDPLSYTNAMDIFVLASVQEGLPRVILEAMLMGKPVIAARIPGPAEQIVPEETGLLFEPDDLDGLTRDLARLAENPETCARMGRAGRERVIGHYSIERYVAGVEQILGA